MQLYYPLEIKNTKPKQEGYASTLKECIKTDNQLQYMNKGSTTQIEETITDTPLTLISPTNIL